VPLGARGAIVPLVPAGPVAPPPDASASPPADAAPATEVDPAPAAETAAPMLPEARAHYERGLSYYAARDFGAAVRELEAGYALDPRREFLFAEAQAYRLAGDCERALPLYRRFLDSDPPPLQVEATRLALDRCAAAAREAAARPVQPPVKQPAPVRPPAREPRHWALDPAALGTAAAGLIALGIGVAFLVSSNRARDGAEAMSGTSDGTHDGFDSLWATAERRRTFALWGFAGAAALLGTAAARLAILRRRAEETTPRPATPAPSGVSAAAAVSVAAWPAGGALLVEGRF
jgi:tetratricopeptide (TPR) repeat protein